MGRGRWGVEVGRAHNCRQRTLVIYAAKIKDRADKYSSGNVGEAEVVKLANDDLPVIVNVLPNDDLNNRPFDKVFKKLSYDIVD